MALSRSGRNDGLYMLTTGLVLIASLMLIAYGADRFVAGAVAIAHGLGVAPLIIGLTLVGFATSIPEVIVSSAAALQDRMAMAVGNAVGSNIANAGLILGCCAIMAPIRIVSGTLQREYALMIVAILVGGLLLLNLQLSRIDGIILLVGLGISLLLITRMALQAPAADPLIRESEQEFRPELGRGRALIYFIGGLLLLLGGSELLVRSATEIARHLDVSDLVIGLTIVAVGTSLPELAASIAGLLKRETDIAIGNIIGSNMFNMWAVLGIPALIRPGEFGADLMIRDFPVMLALTALMGWLLFAHKPGHIGRPAGTLLLLCFIGYQGWLFMSPAGPV